MSIEESVRTKLGSRLREIRRLRGWSQKELAARSGLSVRFLGQVESGQGNVSLARLGELAQALGVSFVALLAGTGPHVDVVDRLAERFLSLTDAARRDVLQLAMGPRRTKLALIGLRGAGKSTIGRMVAHRLECRFVVVDELVRQRSGLELSDLFEIHGPGGYHRWCQEVLADELSSAHEMVLEVGGSVVMDPGCWQLLTERARVVWLAASAEAHLERVAEQGDLRPMAGFDDALVRLRTILSAREPLYRRAHQMVDTVELGIEGSTDAVLAALEPQRSDQSTTAK